jgi:hypothetical protein|tara:strand:+ start:4741 stop:5034 length:294 start_codon:yes stop_codon:yes gene_type:complete
MFDFLKPKRTTSLEEHYKKRAYLKEKLRLSEQNGKKQANKETKEEAKKEIKQEKKVKSMFESFQDYATEFAKGQPVMGELNIGGLNGKKTKKRKKRR